MRNIVIAIIGAGPRGLFALECLVEELSKSENPQPLSIQLFERTPYPGHGPVYMTSQPESNWLNVSERALTISSRPPITIHNCIIPTFPSYHNWAGIAPETDDITQPDYFPPRSKLGNYLNERFLSIFLPLQHEGMVTLVNEQVNDVRQTDTNLIVVTNSGEEYLVDEALITIGHQPTEIDEQLGGWKKEVEKKSDLHLFTSPYPLSDFIDHPGLTTESRIALRGFGLAMVDVARGIALKFGKFEKSDTDKNEIQYLTSESIKNLLIPFSLDGLPLSPKPLNARVDFQYKPSKDELSKFASIIGDQEVQSNATSPGFVIEAIIPIIERVYRSISESLKKTDSVNDNLEIAIEKWLEDDDYEHQLIISKKRPTAETIRRFIEMATGVQLPSLDYTIGQVWRHCEPTMYEQLSYNNCSDEVFASVIALDERMKRYAYGPPVESMQQMLALVDSEVMNLEYVNNPTLEVTDEGWKLSTASSQITVHIMINSVLDAPRLLSVNTPIIKNMLDEDLMQAIHSDLGVQTNSQAYIVSGHKQKDPAVALLGRLAKGTVLGVDAILECFGNRPRIWARECARRIAAASR